MNKGLASYAPLNDTNRNWERALLKAVKSGGSSTPKKGVYNIEICSFSIDDYIQAVEEDTGTEIEPELIDTPALPQISVYHIITNGPLAAGYAVLHYFNDLKVKIEVADTGNVFQSSVSGENEIGELLIRMGTYDYSLNYNSSFEYVKDLDLQCVIEDCEKAFIRYTFPSKLLV